MLATDILINIKHSVLQCPPAPPALEGQTYSSSKTALLHPYVPTFLLPFSGLRMDEKYKRGASGIPLITVKCVELVQLVWGTALGSNSQENSFPRCEQRYTSFWMLLAAILPPWGKPQKKAGRRGQHQIRASQQPVKVSNKVGIESENKPVYKSTGLRWFRNFFQVPFFK